ncbi:MAG: SDR family oxidoreductase [Chloroflexota bacterium]
MPRPVGDQVVVITGASSGIGRETALEFGRRGASVVLAARNAEALAEVARQVERAGGQALAVTADVAEWDQVERIAEQAIERFGRIDTWVNNAGIAVYATLEDTSPEEIDRVIRVNLVGEMYGSKAAVARMRPNRSGTIINVASVLGERAVPLQAAYCASKHGVKGFSEALRMEMQGHQTGIDVVAVFPSSMNTPLFEHARSKLGVKPQPVAPVYEPRVVAQAIVHAAERPQRNITVGGAGKALSVLQRVSEGALDRYMSQGRRMEGQQKSADPDDGRDNVFEASVGRGSVTGSFGRHSSSTSFYTTALEQHPRRKALLGLAAAGAGLVLLRRLGR